MVKRLILTVLVATGGAGMYIFGSGMSAPKKDGEGQEIATAANDEPVSTGEWQVEYVDGEGNPIQRDLGFGTGRLKATSNSLMKRIPGLSTSKRSSASDNSPTVSDKEGARRTSGG